MREDRSEEKRSKEKRKSENGIENKYMILKLCNSIIILQFYKIFIILNLFLIVIYKFFVNNYIINIITWKLK
jgi:hypothetical protein